MARAIWTTKHGYDGGLAQGYAAFDALHETAFVVPRSKVNLVNLRIFKEALHEIFKEDCTKTK